MAQMRPLTHTVPTHLNVPDTVLTIGSLSLTARQFLILLIGSSLSYNLWHQLHMLSLYAFVGTILRVCLALVPILLALVFALARIAGRSLEIWFVILLRYWVQSKRFVWRSVRLQPALLYPNLPGEAEVEEQATPLLENASVQREKERN